MTEADMRNERDEDYPRSNHEAAQMAHDFDMFFKEQAAQAHKEAKVSNDYYIDDEERPDDSEMMAAHDEYFWHKAQQEQDMPAHKRSDFAERMYEQADMNRKALREQS